MTSHVYFIRPVGMDGPVKIGVSSWPYERRATLMSWSPIPLEVVATINGDRELEKRFHAAFWDYRRHGEWFESSPALRAMIDDIAGGRFSLDSLPAPRALPCRHRDRREGAIAGAYTRRLGELAKAGVEIPQEVREAARTYRKTPEQVRACRALVQEFVERHDGRTWGHPSEQWRRRAA
jgi:Meiotically Up-regulated Gene 113 (MUG113) protein